MRIAALYQKLRRLPLKNALLLSLLNQCITSGGNFAVGIYLARTLTLREFGIYGICYGICMLYLGVGNAIILTQMLVNMVEVDASEQAAYAGRMLVSVLLLGALALIVVLLLALGVCVLTPAARVYLPTIGAVAAAAVLFLCKEFFIRYAYLVRTERLAVGVSAVAILTLAIGLGFEHAWGIRLTVNHVLLLSAAGAAFGAIVGYGFSPLHIGAEMRAGCSNFGASWYLGRWALGGVVVTWLQSQTYTYVLAAMLGPAGVGQANAARIFISPFSFLLPAVNQIALPRLAELRRHAPNRLLRVGVCITGALLLLALLYSAMLLQTLSLVTQLVLGHADPTVQSLIWIWCVVVINQMVLNGGSNILQVMRQFRVLTLLNLISAVTALLAACVLVQVLGAPGAIWAVAVGEVLLSILIWRDIRGAHGQRR